MTEHQQNTDYENYTDEQIDAIAADIDQYSEGLDLLATLQGNVQGMVRDKRNQEEEQSKEKELLSISQELDQLTK